MKKIPFPTSVVTMTCSHQNTYKASAPRKGDYVLCQRCNDYRYVTQVTRKGVVKV